MYDTGHSEGEDDVRKALSRLEDALAQHEQHIADAGSAADDPSMQVLRRSVLLMRDEAERLRALLAAG